MSSSYYTAAQLEEMRKKELRQDLLRRIEVTKAQLNKVDTSTPMGAYMSTVRVRTVQKDSSVSGVDEKAVTVDSFLGTGSYLEALNFSSLLDNLPAAESPTTARLMAILARIEERQIIRREDLKERDRLLSSIHKLLLDKSMDIEDLADLAEMRILSYIEDAGHHSQKDFVRMESLRGEYLALCSLLEKSAKPLLLDELETAIPKLTGLLMNQEEDAYILQALERAMETVGFHMKESCVLQKTEGMLYVSNNSPLCDVFVAKDGGGYLFETVAKAGEDSLNRRNQIEENARSVCSMYERLEKEAAKYGVRLNCVDLIPPQYEEMTTEKEVVSTGNKRKQRQRQDREMQMEG